MNITIESDVRACRCNRHRLAHATALAAMVGTIVAALVAPRAAFAEQGPQWLPPDPQAVPATRAVSAVADYHHVAGACPPACGSGCFPGDQLWLISTRGLARCCALPEDPQVWRCEPQGGWRRSSLDEFLAADDPAMPTSIWMHGNRTSYGESRTIGRQFFDRLRLFADEAPRRLVIWSWPADRIRGGALNDFRVKAARSDVDAYHLAAVVDRIDPRVPIGLVGYSYGARIATGALHALGGGSIRGVSLDRSVVALPRRLRAALLAGAVNGCWLLPAGNHGLAIPQVEQMLITKNPSDRVLKFYPIAEYGRIRTGPQAVGYYGVPGMGRHGADADKVWQLCVTPWVGRNHDLESYTASSGIMSRVAPYALFDGLIMENRELAAAALDHAHQ